MKTMPVAHGICHATTIFVVNVYMYSTHYKSAKNVFDVLRSNTMVNRMQIFALYSKSLSSLKSYYTMPYMI